MAVCEIVGGPRDGERFTVPGAMPPEQIKIMDTVGGPLVMWHLAARGHPKYAHVRVVVIELEDTPTSKVRVDSPWRYVWPRGGPPGTNGGPPLL